jgi:hypothetical protein
MLQRVLNQEQEIILMTALKPNPPANIVMINWNSKENFAYTSKMFNILTQARWDVLNLSINRRPDPSLAQVGWSGNKSASYLALVKGLNDAGISFEESEAHINGDYSIALDMGVIEMTQEQIVLDKLR